MKKASRLFSLLALTLTVFLATGAYAQILEPVKWSYEQKKISEDVVELHFKADIDPGWHLYSQDIPEGGPIPTSFNFDDSDKYKLIGETSEPSATEEYDDNFEMVLKFFDESATFKQKIKVLSEEDFKATGELEFMCCDDKQCLPPDYRKFSFDIKGVAGASQQVTEENTTEDSEAETGQPAEEKAAKADLLAKGDTSNTNEDTTTAAETTKEDEITKKDT